jgi:hypothetical protein
MPGVGLGAGREHHGQQKTWDCSAPTERSFAPENIANGLLRPYGAPNLWLSQRRDVDPEPWLALTWDAPPRIRRITITFNDDVNEDLINLHHHRTPFRVIPELVKDYALEARVDGAWQAVASVTDNRVRRRVHDVDLDAVTDLRLRVLATNGSAYAEVVEVRVYADHASWRSISERMAPKSSPLAQAT